ncbi:hypothetical protein LYSHEL_20370 [Lysobacter helvus]|uniref:STAS/SEC14 domain-containing protein n=2 Tax=Lysobacteraceae TaxID=32033 RepID=A0ABN6FVN7_9GAMM|nr:MULTISPECIES: hypothetical protein [Lysobacter]BCT93014.1 hypothetical protein LYSCAS_20380 [Lysobacter caseinilyticus]BCT96166.1 hypothetical protein LYSHEL_20370 [Lysobacter helvus]
MTHHIVVGPGFVEVVHTGEVRYADRLAALQSVQATDGLQARLPVLINFLDASVLTGTPGVDADEEARVDYMARAITDGFFTNRRIAMVGISARDARPALIAATVRQIAFEVFEAREPAIAWLVAKT